MIDIAPFEEESSMDHPQEPVRRLPNFRQNTSAFKPVTWRTVCAMRERHFSER